MHTQFLYGMNYYDYLLILVFVFRAAGIYTLSASTNYLVGADTRNKYMEVALKNKN